MTSKGRIPPHDHDAEESLLGAMLLSVDAIDAVNGLTADVFHRPEHSHIYTAIRALRVAGVDVSPVTVADQLTRTGLLDSVAGGHKRLIDIMASAPAVTAAASYAAIVARCAQARRLIGVAGEIADAAYHTDIDTAQRHLAGALAEQATTQPHTTRRGGDWLLDQPDGIPTIWGLDNEVLWAQGESLMICGPAGVGKTTLANQLVWARLGLRVEVLGYPVTEASRVLYLAMDRPAQVRRAMARLAYPDERDILNDRLIVHEGPPPQDLARHPHILTQMATDAGADCVFIDSLKDAAIGLSDDETGAGYNQARQGALAAGIDVAELHHQRKGQNGTKPRTLEDVYGSTWIAAGAGSVILLWGQPGDLAVELTHLKQPGEIVGPHTIAHDHDRGISLLEGRFDALTVLRRQASGLTAEAAAMTRYGTDHPSENQRRVVRRQLDKLVTRGHARKIEASTGGATGTQPARWYALDTAHSEDF